jgi:hypothetical protein
MYSYEAGSARLCRSNEYIARGRCGKRARNADVARAVDLSQKGELLTNGPIDPGIKLQVIELIVRIGAEMSLRWIGLIVKQPDKP